MAISLRLLAEFESRLDRLAALIGRSDSCAPLDKIAFLLRYDNITEPLA